MRRSLGEFNSQLSVSQPHRRFVLQDACHLQIRGIKTESAERSDRHTAGVFIAVLDLILSDSTQLKKLSWVDL